MEALAPNQNSRKAMNGELRETARNVKEKVAEGAEELENIYSRFGAMAKEQAHRAADVSTTYIKENPISTVCGAAVLGLVAGFLIARK